MVAALAKDSNRRGEKWKDSRYIGDKSIGLGDCLVWAGSGREGRQGLFLGFGLHSQVDGRWCHSPRNETLEKEWVLCACMV